MPAKNDNITKDPAAAAKKKIGKHWKQKRTKIKEALGLTWNNAEELVEKNILEFLNSKNKKERLLATKFFAEFAKPKKREVTGELKHTFEDYLGAVKGKNA